MNHSDEKDLNEEQLWLENTYKGNKLPELTIKSISLGIVLCFLLISANIYMGLKTSFTEGGSIISAILAFAIIKLFRGNLSILENNIAQTTASSAASIGIMVSVIPALIMFDYQFSALQLFLWIFSASMIGILFAVPLRKQLIVIEKLTFPSGTACAETIKAMHADSREAIDKSKLLSLSAVISAAVTWFRDAVPQVIPYLSSFPGRIFNYPLSELNVGISYSPMLLGIGMLVGIRIGLSLLAGALIGWVITGPVLNSYNIISSIDYVSISGWTMWPAVAIMVTAGITTLLIKWKFILLAFSSMKKSTINNNIEFPFYLWAAAMLIAAILISAVMQIVFDVPYYLTIIAIIISYIFAIVAIRAYGETDVNPVGAVGHAGQIIYGVMAPGNVLTNLMAAGITASGADQSADLMQDYKTGYILGATPKRQTYAQIIGAAAGSIAAVPIFLAIVETYGLGSEKLPAPSAVLWKGLAEILSRGFESLPPYVEYGVIAGCALGLLLSLPDIFKSKRNILSPLGIGIGMIIPPFYSITIFAGAAAGMLIKKYFTTWTEKYYIAAASGVIAGESLAGVLIAVLSSLGVL